MGDLGNAAIAAGVGEAGEIVSLRIRCRSARPSSGRKPSKNGWTFRRWR